MTKDCLKWRQTTKLYFWREEVLLLNQCYTRTCCTSVFNVDMLPRILIFANWNKFYTPLRWLESADIKCMKKTHGCQLKIILDFQITHHWQEARTERKSLIKVSLKSGQNHWKIPLKYEGVHVLLKLLTEGLQIY